MAMNTNTAEKAIGWLGIGLGAVELVVPGWLEKQLGTESHQRLMRLFGVRGMLAGIGGSGVDVTAWSRLASETIDLTGLAGVAQRRMQEGRVGTTLIALAALTALDALVAQGRKPEPAERIAKRGREEKAVVRARTAARRSGAKSPPSTH
jgi:hypothetical protein